MGIPTLVEVKRRGDTRIRREVVGQMFDYAANAVVYWPEGQIRSRYESDCEGAGTNPDQQLADFLRLADDPDSCEDAVNRFWIEVDSNLRAGRIRMVFVADMIPPELRRIVEFLNGQMYPAEVLAIEIKQFAGLGVVTLVPTVIGQTAQDKAIRESLARGYDNSQTIHIVDLSRVRATGKRRAAIDALTQGMTIAELKRVLETQGLKGYAGWALKTAAAAQAIRVE